MIRKKQGFRILNPCKNKMQLVGWAVPTKITTTVRVKFRPVHSFLPSPLWGEGRKGEGD
jgi:hypothetical protein